MARILIVGAGIAGLATAFELRRSAPQHEILIFEASDRAGGKIQTDFLQPAGGGTPFLVENGPNGVLDNQPWTLNLARAAGLESEIIQSNEDARRRYVYFKDRLRRLPESPPAFIRSDLLTWPAKLRAAREWFVRRAPAPLAATETVAEFTRRRLGGAVLDAMVAPFVTGVFAGDAEQLELSTAFPRMAALEREHGGLLRALVSIERGRRRAARAGNPKPPPTITSLKNGMGSLTGALAASLKTEISLSTRATRIERIGGRFKVSYVKPGFEGGTAADVVVLAGPAPDSAHLIQHFCEPAARELLQIRAAPIAIVALGFTDAADCVSTLDGFGFLAARGEKLRILGALAESSIWPREQGGVLVRCMMGGALAPDILNVTDDQLIQIAREDLALATGLRAVPTVARVIRWEAAIPQYVRGHGARVAAIDRALAGVSNLHLTGAYYRGVSVNDICRNAFELATSIAKSPVLAGC